MHPRPTRPRPVPARPAAMRGARPAALSLTVALTVAACAGGGPVAPELADAPSGPVILPATPDPDAADTGAADTENPDTDAPDVELPADPQGSLAARAATAFFASAPVVLVCDGDDPDTLARATTLGTEARVPVLCGAEPADFAATVDALNVRAALTVGDVPDGTLGVTQVPVPEDAVAAALRDGSLGERVPAIDEPRGGWMFPQFTEPQATDDGAVGSASNAEPSPPVVLTLADPAQASVAGPARATAVAAGATIVETPTADPRASAATVEALTDVDPAHVVALGDGWGTSEDLGWKLATAATGVQLPGGGQTVVPGKIYVALYGTPGTGALGILGEQGVDATIVRAQETAGWYAELTEQTVVPTLEIIASVASAGPGHSGMYSNVQPVATLRPLVDAAREAGQYVVLDLQPGREDFLTQAHYYEELLREPHVGLALDPEWRLKPDQVHLRQIGQVGVEEVDEVVTYLADLTREHHLPQKFLVLHAFQNRMIVGLDDVDRSRDELEILVHVDGQGGQGAKQTTWATLQRYAPSITSWGWKNFIDEDVPMLTPGQTIANVHPTPVFISYQ